LILCNIRDSIKRIGSILETMPIKQKKYYQLMPEKLKADLPTIEPLIRSMIPGYCPDYLFEVISIVALHVRKDEGRTPLKMAYIKKLVPGGDNYIKTLLEAGVIERSGYYVPGQSCYKYCFAAKYDSKYITSPLNNAKLLRRIEKAQESLKKEAAKTVKGHSEQVHYLNKLTIDGSYLEYLEKNLTAGTDQFNSISASATRIINGHIKYSIDKTSGRFHSNVTNLAKELRPYLRINGEPLVNIDIKNSQPYLSIILLTNPGKVSGFAVNPAFAMMLTTLKVSLTEDVKKYIFLVSTGTLYEFLQDHFKRDGLDLSRNETKEQVLRILFARNRSPKDITNRRARDVFKANFKTVHRIFCKVRGNARGDKFSSFKRFSILLQTIESFLMLDVIMKRIYRELPGTIAVTVHDSIMTGILTNNVEAVRKIMEEELTNFVGMRPQIKIEGLEGEKKGKSSKKRRDAVTNQYDATTFISFS